MDSLPTRSEATEILERAIALEGSDIYVPPNTDRASVANHIRVNICDPFVVRAKVMEPGFPFTGVGEELEGVCIAHANGLWLVYQESEDRFLCFWGASKESLGAHGVFGNPLYCWSA